MSPIALTLDDVDVPDVAAFYAAQAPRARPAATDPARVAAGRLLAEQHHCTSCHRPDLTGQQQAARLAGQDLDYLLRLLRAFKAKTASDLDGTMTVAAQPLQDEEIVSLAHFLASLGPATER
jgi:cytochrome c553